MTDIKQLQAQKPSLHQLYIEIFPAAILPCENLDCVWTISTGRCGTMTLSQLLDLSPSILSMHEPMPRLWDCYIDSYLNPDNDFCDRIIHMARIDILSTMAYLGYKYAETSHRMTFFAPSIKRVFPRSKFIYIKRPMDDFIRSAYLWGWYEPTMDRWLSQRPQSSHKQKDRANLLAWYWCSVNEFCMDFIKSLQPEDWFFIKFDDIKNKNYDRFYQMYDWLDVPRPDIGKIEGILIHQYNKGRDKDKNHVKKTWEAYNERASRICQTSTL